VIHRYLFYNDKYKNDSTYINIATLARMIARGRRMFGRKPDYPDKTHVVEQMMT